MHRLPQTFDSISTADSTRFHVRLSMGARLRWAHVADTLATGWTAWSLPYPHVFGFGTWRCRSSAPQTRPVPAARTACALASHLDAEM